jgi:hypothetical protein
MQSTHTAMKKGNQKTYGMPAHPTSLRKRSRAINCSCIASGQVRVAAGPPALLCAVRLQNEVLVPQYLYSFKSKRLLEDRLASSNIKAPGQQHQQQQYS